ncbi:MAG: SPFH domain-containing protein [Clostridia bacterium]|nr:SPFH domain-containing protein [Clostridia bacterium]MBQ2669699.1 SPFH domain-containing protein [Clostridia bacterium]MBQ3463348.1 SPFH domain-containing protein [Clostridia bacterium]MBQ6530048.1 SPFH domain-containing protein [Clostridia bacterium]MBR0470242.1 SPFH domain-containing protein [Clostridia bacterium]
MGLLKAGVGALSGVLADSWREYFYCESMNADTLAVKGVKRTSKRSSNTKGDENIISNGSIVAINDGQCMIIVDQGKVVEICAEPGEYVYDMSTEPSLFYGNLGENIKKTFEQLGKRFTFGGDTAKDQRVYYFNTKEIVGNKYGTPSPVPFRVVDRNIGLDVDIAIRCHGEYSYKLTDPILFYTNVCGNVSSEYKRDEIDSQLKTELLTALQPAFAKISEMGIRYSALPGHTMEMSQALNEILSAQWRDRRGIEIVAFGVSSVNASEEDEKMIKEIQRNAALRDPNMAAAHLTGAQAQAMQDAAKNEGGMGAMGGFFGMNMAQNAAGGQAANLFAMGQQQAAKPAGGWTCECGTENSGKFCSNCGKPQPQGWTCECGTQNSGKFCQNCGKPKPEGFTCPKCGYKGTGAPKFCPECGNAF